ncbi:MAG: hypothetical protein H6713_34250 [Myxococcales bacterium]|nr:hypothetical protein [Myxococcales bacterium]MCB9755027.1 hypothetical protein [Myxococcales bacterium]
MSTAEATSREQIQRAFATLLKTHESAASRLATKAEEAERKQDQEVVGRASSYTVKAIVEGLAGLQLEVGDALSKLSERMSAESAKLVELRRAIEVETRRNETIRNTLVAAEALALLKRNNQRELEEFEESSKKSLAELEEQISSQREEWKREEEEHNASVKEFETNLAREREQAAADRKYELERKAKVQVDENAAKELQLDRDLSETTAGKEKDWAAREKHLAEHEAEIVELREKAEKAKAKIDDAANKAREKAAAAVKRDAKIEAELREKESKANVEVFELQIKTLEERISNQSAELADLKNRLAEARDRVQQLAVDALKSTVSKT